MKSFLTFAASLFALTWAADYQKAGADEQAEINQLRVISTWDYDEEYACLGDYIELDLWFSATGHKPNDPASYEALCDYAYLRVYRYNTSTNTTELFHAEDLYSPDLWVPVGPQPYDYMISTDTIFLPAGWAYTIELDVKFTMLDENGDTSWTGSDTRLYVP